MKINNYVLCLTAFLVSLFAFTSCAALEGLFGPDAVLAHESYLKEGEEAPVVPWETLPEEVREFVPEETVIVLADEDQLIEEAAYIPLVPEEDDLGAIIDALFGIGSTFIPGLAAWEGIVTLFSRRKRQNYAKAIRAAAPIDSRIDLAGAVGGIAAAMGMAHTSDASKQAVEDEEAELLI